MAGSYVFWHDSLVFEHFFNLNITWCPGLPCTFIAPDLVLTIFFSSALKLLFKWRVEFKSQNLDIDVLIAIAYHRWLALSWDRTRDYLFFSFNEFILIPLIQIQHCVILLYLFLVLFVSLFSQNKTLVPNISDIYSYVVSYNTQKIITLITINYPLDKIQDFFAISFLLRIISQSKFCVQTFNCFPGDYDSNSVMKDEKVC